MPFEHIVSEEEDNIRIDKIVANINRNISYSYLQKAFRTNHIKVNGKKIQSSHRVHYGDVVQIYMDIDNNSDGQNVIYNQDNIDQFENMIIFENEDFLAINKPSHLAVQLGTKISFCVETLMKAYQAVKKCEFRLVHRIDKDTSGILLIAKNVKIARKLTALFRDGEVLKTYIAIVDGKLHNAGIIDNYLKKTFVGNEEKMEVQEFGKKAITRYQILKTPDSAFQNFSVLKLQPLTGRKHQLRVHCSESLNAPILGDKKYNQHCIHKNLFLHAYQIMMKNLNIKITAPMPKYFPKIDGI